MRFVSQVEKSKLIKQLSTELKKSKEVTPPSWATYVKTGTHRARPPKDNDWWYARAASMIVKTSSLGAIGVSKLRTQYGGKKRRGHQPPEFRRGSGSVIRKIFQQLEKSGYMKQQTKGVHKGRVLTPKGRSFMNTVAKAMIKNGPERLARPAKGPAAGAATDKA
jgi:small subunit ribosomal protein S19e